jgi:hypothetical protein
MKRFRSVTLGMGLSGIHISGNPLLRMGLVIDGEFREALSAAVVSFGEYRRITGSVSVEKAESIVFRLEIQGCASDEVAISGICMKLGETAPPMRFVSSLVDRALPSGVTFMFEGDSCPPGFEDLEDNRMALVSGTKAFQSVGGDYVNMLGSDTHDHTPETNGLDPASTDSIITETPLKAIETAIIRAVPFNDYPSTVPFQPYPGEQPVTVLGVNHSHRIRTNMTAVPPSFPVRLCKKL